MTASLNAATRTFATSALTNVSDVQKATGLSKQVATAALTMASQIHILEETSPGSYEFIGDPNLRLSPKDGLSQFFREAAQQFPPFLLYLSLRVRGFDESESSRQTASIFGLGLAPDRIVTVFGRWTRYCGIVDNSGVLQFRPKEVLEIGFLGRLASALGDELSTKTFVINEVGSAIAGNLYTSGIDLDAISRALVAHERNPKEALQEAGNLFEAYLARLSGPIGGPQALLIPMLDWLLGNAKVILKTHRSVGYGIAGLRNAADHGADPDTGKAWRVSSEAALLGTLLVLLSLKSLERYSQNQSQEI